MDIKKNIENKKKSKKNKKEAMPPMQATWNMSELLMRRADAHFYRIEYYYIMIYQNHIKNWIMPYVAEAKNMYANIHAIGQDKELEKKINKLYKWAKEYVRIAKQNRRYQPEEKIYDMIDDIHFGIQTAAQKQGWRLGAEQKNDKNDFSNL